MSTPQGALVPGAVLQGGSRTVTDAEISFLPALMGALNPLFHDEVSASRGPMRGRILYGPALLGISVALTEPLLRQHVKALVGITDIAFRRPVRAGDTVTASLTVTGLSARQDRGDAVLTVDDQVVNQDGEPVLTFARTVLVRDSVWEQPTVAAT